MRMMLMSARREQADEPLVEVDAAGLGAALVTVVDMWANGYERPPQGCRVEKTLVRNPAGEVLGFNYYLVHGEPVKLGGIPEEVEEGSLTAAEAAELSTAAELDQDPFAALEPGSEEAEEFIVQVLWQVTIDLIKERAAEGKRSLMAEPFAGVPRVFHPSEVEDRIMGRIITSLHEKKYRNPQWERRDGRPVLTVRW